MSVGGRLLEIRTMTIPERTKPVVRLWLIATNAGGPGVHDEICVYAEPSDELPAIGDGVWWQGRKIFFAEDRRQLVRVGYSFTAPGSDHV